MKQSTNRSACCDAEMTETGQCLNCGSNGAEELCEFCQGEGEVSMDATDGEGNWRRGVEVGKCICQIEK